MNVSSLSQESAGISFGVGDWLGVDAIFCDLISWVGLGIMVTIMLCLVLGLDTMFMVTGLV